MAKLWDQLDSGTTLVIAPTPWRAAGISGPSASTAAVANDTLVLDESAVGADTGPGAGTPVGLRTITADYSNNFTASNYGTDDASEAGSGIGSFSTWRRSAGSPV